MAMAPLAVISIAVVTLHLPHRTTFATCQCHLCDCTLITFLPRRTTFATSQCYFCYCTIITTLPRRTTFATCQCHLCNGTLITTLPRRTTFGVCQCPALAAAAPVLCASKRRHCSRVRQARSFAPLYAGALPGIMMPTPKADEALALVTLLPAGDEDEWLYCLGQPYLAL